MEAEGLLVRFPGPRPEPMEPFEPVKVEGQPLSEMIIQERGER
jgi:hypothetical protein